MLIFDGAVGRAWAGVSCVTLALVVYAPEERHGNRVALVSLLHTFKVGSPFSDAAGCPEPWRLL